MAIKAAKKRPEPKDEEPGLATFQDELVSVSADYPERPGEEPGVIGRTMFDQPGSQDMQVTVLLSMERAQLAPSQSLVRIVSGDQRAYLGVVTAGPFAEPDSLRADSPVLMTVATRGVPYAARYHGRVLVEILGEIQPDGSTAAPRLRPLPHSAVSLLTDEEAAVYLKAGGDIRLGLAAGHERVEIGVPSTSKSVLPKHTAILGTTGAGKSTTVARLIHGAAKAGMAVIVLDVEGEYARLHEPTHDDRMKALLTRRGLAPEGIARDAMRLYHLVGREPSHAAHPGLSPFSLQFARLSPHVLLEMLGANEAQSDRFLFAYELCKRLLRETGEFPQKDAAPEEQARQERMAASLDEFERGYPRVTLSLFLDVVEQCLAMANKTTKEPFCDLLKNGGLPILRGYLENGERPSHPGSWGKLKSLLWRMKKMNVFDKAARPIKYAELLTPGRVSVIDLADSGLAALNNIAVADVLRGVQEEQDKAYRAAEKGGPKPSRVLLVVEEAHEFFGKDKIEKTPYLYEQLTRIAKRGRKRWLGLTFVTQSPSHMPRQVLELCNNFVLHKLTDPYTVQTLRQTVHGVDDGLWRRLPELAPGQAIVAMGHMARPVLAAIDPAPGRLRMAE